MSQSNIFSLVPLVLRQDPRPRNVRGVLLQIEQCLADAHNRPLSLHLRSIERRTPLVMGHVSGLWRFLNFPLASDLTSLVCFKMSTTIVHAPFPPCNDVTDRLELGRGEPFVGRFNVAFYAEPTAHPRVEVSSERPNSSLVGVIRQKFKKVKFRIF